MHRAVKLVTCLLAGFVAAALMLVGYQKFSERRALAEVEDAQINPKFVRAVDALDPSDPLYLAIYKGGYSSAISSVLSGYIKRPDVIARGEPKVEERASSWSLLGGPSPAYWRRSTQWCVRIKYREGDPSFFADALFRIQKLENAPALTLPERTVPLPPQELQAIMAKYADGVVLAVEFAQSGESKRKINSSSWRLLPISAICPTIGQLN